MTKRNLTILILAEWDFAGCGYFLSQAINQHTDHTACAVRLHASPLNFPYDVQAPGPGELASLWTMADVIHIHDDYRSLPPGLPPRPTVVTYHGTLYRSAPQTYNRRDGERGWLQTAATLDLELRWLPDTRPSMRQYVNRVPGFKVCHAPTKRKLKGTNAVIRACRGAIDLDVIEDMVWTEALRRKGVAWATLDQFKLGYGCNAIEAWMMGQPVVAGATDDRVLVEIEKRAGGYLPFVRADETIASIRAQVERLRDDAAFYADAQQRGADYVDRFHSMPAVANIAIELYHEAIETFDPRNVQIPVENRIEYVGQSAGLVSFEVNGRQYAFSRLHPIQSVAPDDIAMLLRIRDNPKGRGRRDRRPGALLFRRVI